ncbi:MAG: 5'-methylthioadenosine/adenosylhomocysteine nucleosidase, partial [Lacisediminimonas sp.]|nr:5'-methylthioadenosine/adenosylhomocysteine nucleosidase [Lacisediminimonas sp.]
GLIGSGDEFIHHAERLGQLRSMLPGLLAVEMEGAAVAQVCFEFGIPFAIVRTISDSADAGSAIDFMRFIDKVASQYAFHLIRRFCEHRTGLGTSVG